MCNKLNGQAIISNEYSKGLEYIFDSRRLAAGILRIVALTMVSACGTTVSGSDQQVFVFTVPAGASINLDLSGHRASSPPVDPFVSPSSVNVPQVMTADQIAVRPAGIDVSFAAGSARLDPSAERELVALALALRNPDLNGTRFLIAGHTDASGDVDRNRALSQQRAEAVRAFLIDPGGVDPLRLVARGYGSDMPLDPDNPHSTINRRVEITRL